MIDGLALAVPSAKPVVGSAKIRLEYFLKYQIGALTDYTIHYDGYAQLAHLCAALFGYQHSSSRFEPIDAGFELLMDDR
jgi:hypothetical protein